MESKARNTNQTALWRIFVLQICLIVTVGLLSILATVWPQSLGSFWFAFFAGCIGGSVALLKRIRKGNAKFVEELANSWIATLMPLLYGGVMAGVAYLLFMAKILSGDQEGLFTSNLFPMFTKENPEPGELFSFKEVIKMRPASLMDFGKLLVWCFLAGYSERFVMGVLKQLEERGEGRKS